ncbi:unnamed protein product [Polarella glacialis]|uniref:Fructose-bisphosphate aldolase n=1 Tax=Polarella glacialis TaxID=89957 RepID=A0A813E8U8_POLGL|nr:unnamed protein product [Polarella glacialis]
MTIPIKEIQNVKIIEGEGFFAALDVGGGSQTVQLLLEYGVEVSSLSPKQQQGQLQAFRSRILTNPAINGSRAIAVAISDDFMRHEISGLPAPKYLWEVKQVVTFLKIDRGCQPEKDGMQLVKTAPKLDDLLAEAKDACIFGTKMKSVIKSPNEAGIEAVVKQQLALCRRVMAKDLVPCMQIEVDINATEKERCEHLLCLALIDSLQSFNASEKVVLWLTLPNKPNSYLSLMGHPNVLRVVALSGGYDQPTAYGMLADNVGMIAGFGRTILGGLKVAMDDEEFTKVLTGTCDHMFQASRRIAFQSGMLAAMDQSIAANTMQSGTVIPLLQDYGIGIDESTTKLEVLKHAHEMRLRMITSSSFNGSLVIGALLDEDTMTRQISRLLAAKYLWEQKSVVPFMKLDRGTLPEKDGVQLLNLKDMSSVLAAIDKAKTFGCLGVKTRAVIRLPNASGIKALVVQQFEVAGLILSKDMVPFLQLEVDLNSPDQGSCERILRQALMAQLRTLKQGEQVVLSMSLPSKAGIYNAFTEHPNVLRVAALSGGVKQRAACDKLAGNSGMVAAFGRALLEGALASQKEKEFSATLDKSIKMIVKASCSGPEATRAPSKERAAAEAAA